MCKNVLANIIFYKSRETFNCSMKMKIFLNSLIICHLSHKSNVKVKRIIMLEILNKACAVVKYYLRSTRLDVIKKCSSFWLHYSRKLAIIIEFLHIFHVMSSNKFFPVLVTMLMSSNSCARAHKRMFLLSSKHSLHELQFNANFIHCARSAWIWTCLL
jgi:hypothetical protein